MALNETPEQPSDGLTVDESAAIRLYTIEWDEPDLSLYAMLNRTLKNNNREHLQPYFKYLKLFLTALAKLPCLPPLTIWRGVTKNLSTNFSPGTPVTWWAFSSCTTSLTVLENDIYLGTTGDRTLFSIEAINGRTIHAHSHFLSEDEVLLLPGTHMIVQSQLNPGAGLHIVHLKQIIPETTPLEPPFKGLEIARDRLGSVYHNNPGLTYADLYTLAAVVAVEKMGGPIIKWRHGRVDFENGKNSPPSNRLPSASQDAQSIRFAFYRMGFNDREIVALIGAHSLGRCHTDRSGFEGQWTLTPTTFSNEFFRGLLEDTWEKRNWQGPTQFEDVQTKSLLRLPSDILLIEDPQFKVYVVEYANNGSQFAVDFANAFGKLLELGVDFPATY
ncbi:unnamed protein product [Rotaria sp. Silwood1]|nr:unnamed protein product [Rotaria sp. Silwood1]